MRSRTRSRATSPSGAGSSTAPNNRDKRASSGAESFPLRDQGSKFAMACSFVCEVAIATLECSFESGARPAQRDPQVRLGHAEDRADLRAWQPLALEENEQ